MTVRLDTADSVLTTLVLGMWLSDGVLEFTTPWVKVPVKEGTGRTGRRKEASPSLEEVTCWRRQREPLLFIAK